ncbi:MAG: periplasmic heavy metal sensor [Bacteroidota bacterium]
MKSKLFTALIAILILSGNLYSQPEPKDKKECKKHEMENPPMFLPGAPPLNIPGLTPEQHEKLKAADMNHLEAVIPLRTQIVEKQSQLVILLTSKTFDNNQANTLADDIGKLRAEILKQDILHDQNMRLILTREQRIHFDCMPKPFLLP